MSYSKPKDTGFASKVSRSTRTAVCVVANFGMQTRHTFCPSEPKIRQYF